MPYDGSGNFDLVNTYNPVAPGTIIDDDWANVTLSDIATGLSSVVARDGQTPMSGPLKLASGTPTVPSLSFNSEASTGLFWPGTNTLGFTVGAGERMRLLSNGNLIIGSVSDGGQKLQVNGTAAIVGNTTVGGTLGVSGVLTIGGVQSLAAAAPSTSNSWFYTAAYATGQGDNRTHFGYNNGSGYVNYIRGATSIFSGAVAIDGNLTARGGLTVLDSGNFNSYSPTLTGTGASGTWSINVTGNAGTVGGYPAASASTANTVPIRDSSAHIYVQNVHQASANSDNVTVSQIIINNGGDGFLRKASIAHVAGSIGAQNVTPTGTWNFESINSVGTVGQAGRVVAYTSGGGSAAMSFHRSGSYAVNFGLDSDNVMRLGGWSDGATYRLQSDTAGNMTIRGSFCPSNGVNYLRSTTSSYGGLEIVGTNGGYAGISLNTSAAGVHIMYDASGNGGAYDGDWQYYWNTSHNCLGVGASTTSASYKLYVSGGIYATSDITAYSDKRAKTDFTLIDSALDKVARLTGYAYSWKDSGKRSTGLVAQDVEAVLPEAVHTSEDDKKGVNYNGVIALLVEAVKTLKLKVEALEAVPA